MHNVPQPVYNKSDKNYGIANLRNISDSINEGYPVVKQHRVNDSGYDILQQCDANCSSDCLEIKKYVPLDVVVQCQRAKCNCWYDLDTPIVQ